MGKKERTLNNHETDQSTSDRERLLSELITMVPGVVYQFYSRPNGQMGFYYISPNSEQILGLKPELEGYLERFATLLIPEPRDGFLKSIEKSVREATEWKFEGMLQKPSGEKIWISGNSNPSPRADEMVFNGIVQDITDRKRASYFLQLVVNNIPDFVFWKNRQSVFIGCNNAFAKAAGVGSSENIIGKTDYDLKWKKEESDFFVATDRIVMETNQAQYHIIEPQFQADGKQAWLETCKVPLHNEQGQVIGILGTYMDITERKHAEEELRKAQKLESLGLLAGGIAHDFNNLMGGIFGYIDLASNLSKDDTLSDHLEKAMNTINRARGLTQQLLTFAKGGAPIQKISRLFPFVKETAQFALSGANVSCHFDIQEDLWACNFDKNQIGQVIDNIIINAQQAMPVGGTIELTARNVTLAEKEHALLLKGDYVKLSVKDYGVGIQRELVSKIFDPFFTTKPRGHGLGLATSFSIVKRHDGCIDVESEMGKGSTFHVYLPASTDPVLSSKEKPKTMHKGNGVFLVMDDEEVIRETVGRILTSFGYTVVCKANGSDAVEFFEAETKEQRTVAGMLFDLTVPGGMGGVDAVQRIRKTTTEVPVFVASGYADDPIMKNPAEHGFTASICKPFRISELSEILNTYMRR